MKQIPGSIVIVAWYLYICFREIYQYDFIKTSMNDFYSDQMKYQFLGKYADFLREKHLIEFAHDNLERALEINIPLMKIFSHLSKEELLQLAVSELEKYLISIRNGEALKLVRLENEAWVKGELPSITREQVELIDIIFAQTIRKQSLIKFIETYTHDVKVYEKLIFELEDFFLRIAQVNYSSFLTVQREMILKEKELTEKVLDASLQGIVALKAIRDKKGTIIDLEYTLANNIALQMLNRKAEDLIGKKITTEFPGTKQEGIFDRYVKVIETGIPFDIEYHYFHEGFDMWLRQAGMKWEDGLVLSTLDITSQKTNEEAVKIINTELESRVKQRTKELEIKNKELTKTNQDLDNFIYTASHDLKAPVSNIEGLIKVLANSLEEREIKDEEINEILNLVNVSIDKFQKTIKDLTEITKYQKNINEDIEELNIKELIEDVKTSIQTFIIKSQAEIIESLSPNASLKFSKKNMRSIIYNLLTNAIKYKSDERRPIINISFCKDGEWAKLEVKDNGLGIAEQNKEKLFSMFKRFHTHVEGTGIGLYIVKRIVENNGGKVEVESNLGKGTTFKLYLKEDE